MKKIVTDDPQDNVEVMMNLAFVKDKEVWIRGGGDDGEDCTLIDFTNRMCASHDCLFDIQNESEEDDIGNTGDRLLECSMSGCSVGTTYFIAIQAAELRERLRMYEEKDADNQGRQQGPKHVGEWNDCPRCGKVLSPIQHIHFCGTCGQEVEWS